MVLEELETAASPRSRIYGEIIGTASGTVVDRRGVAHRGQALANVMRATLRDAGATIDDVGHIHAHGLSTRTQRHRRSLGDSRSVWPAGRTRFPWWPPRAISATWAPPRAWSN